MNKVSLFPTGIISKEGKLAPAVIPAMSLDFDTYLDMIAEGAWQDEVLQYRAGKIQKLTLKGITASGVFTYRNSKSLSEHSGFLALDLDVKDNPSRDMTAVKQLLQEDPYVYAYHHSAGGFGLVAYVKIASDRHLDAYLALERYFANTYELITDSSCKNVDRYRFVSYDPDMHKAKTSKAWKTYLKKAEVEVKRTYVYSDLDMAHIFQQISDNGKDLTEDFHDWRNMGFALCSKYGEAGRDYFHHISQYSTKYDMVKLDAFWDYIVKRTENGITMATFFWLCIKNGISVKTERTEHIERLGKIRRKSGQYATPAEAMKSARDVLAEVDHIQGPDVEQVLAAVMQIPEKELNEKTNNLVADIKIFLQLHGITFNQITRNYEVAGMPITDRDLNSIYIKAIEQVDPKIKKEMIMSIIESEATREFNPFTDFVSQNKHLLPEGNFEKLCSCIDFEQFTISADGHQERSDDYVKVFLKKWLLSLIASMHGTYSIYVLVLTGPQGNGKTNFFRGLLPDELMPYYAESKLDEGKDSEILMTKKIIVMDDEFSGKSKQDAKRLKELSSKQVFNVRRPYGKFSEDLRRLAVLCGTSNEEEIINDPTGNRRIIPINVKKIDLVLYESINKTDLFIELYHEWEATGDAWMFTQADILKLNQATRENEQPSQEYEIISNFYAPADAPGGNAVYLTTTDIKNRIEADSEIKLNFFKMGATLKALGFKKYSVREGSVVRNKYLCQLLR